MSEENKKEDQQAAPEPTPPRRRSATDTLDEHVDEATDLGSVQIHNNVISSIARLAALKVPGVAELSGSFVDGLAGMIGKKPVDRGIHVELVDNAVVLDLHVILDFGVRIPHVSWQIQSEVRQAVEQMTGKSVRQVNVVVQGLRFPEEQKDKMQEGDSI